MSFLRAEHNLTLTLLIELLFLNILIERSRQLLYLTRFRRSKNWNKHFEQTMKQHLYYSVRLMRWWRSAPSYVSFIYIFAHRIKRFSPAQLLEGTGNLLCSQNQTVQKVIPSATFTITTIKKQFSRMSVLDHSKAPQY